MLDRFVFLTRENLESGENVARAHLEGGVESKKRTPHPFFTGTRLQRGGRQWTGKEKEDPEVKPCPLRAFVVVVVGGAHETVPVAAINSNNNRTKQWDIAGDEQRRTNEGGRES